MTAPETAAAAMVRARLGEFRASIGVALGSGLGAFVARLSDVVRVPYAEIPGFPPSTVAGHQGEIVAGRLHGVPLLVQSGRLHLYEGLAADLVALPVRVLAALGVETLILTNAAGGVRPTLVPGTVMLIADHINLTGRNPLVGPVRPGDDRFPDMSEPYDAALRALALDVARERNIPIVEGVYAGVLGPSYETAAEIRMLDIVGASAVGMSTVTDVIAARACRLRCLGLSAITNFACGVSTTALSHADVLAGAAAMTRTMSDLIEGIVIASVGPPRD